MTKHQKAVAATVVVCISSIIGCQRDPHLVQPESCITQPFTSIKSDRDKLVDIAAKLEHVQIDANLKANFKSILEQNFQKLSDKEVSQYLFLQAIDCYLKRAKGDKAMMDIVGPIVTQMAASVLEAYGAPHGISGSDVVLDDNQKELLKSTEFGRKSLARYYEFGFR